MTGAPALVRNMNGGCAALARSSDCLLGSRPPRGGNREGEGAELEDDRPALVPDTGWGLDTGPEWGRDQLLLSDRTVGSLELLPGSDENCSLSERESPE